MKFGNVLEFVKLCEYIVIVSEGEFFSYHTIYDAHRIREWRSHYVHAISSYGMDTLYFELEREPKEWEFFTT